jgi:hypothetical protein
MGIHGDREGWMTERKSRKLEKRPVAHPGSAV